MQGAGKKGRKSTHRFGRGGDQGYNETASHANVPSDWIDKPGLH
jgi:hypothetical protein